MPPTKPSHDFPGEIVGAILCRPDRTADEVRGRVVREDRDQHGEDDEPAVSGMSRSSIDDAEAAPDPDDAEQRQRDRRRRRRARVGEAEDDERDENRREDAADHPGDVAQLGAERA